MQHLISFILTSDIQKFYLLELASQYGYFIVNENVYQSFIQIFLVSTSCLFYIPEYPITHICHILLDSSCCDSFHIFLGFNNLNRSGEYWSGVF